MKNHLKARAAPRTWNIARKEQKFTTRPNPGGQSMEMTLPLGIILRDIEVGTTKKELNYIIKNSEVLVNGVRRWDVRFPVGFMDILALPALKKHYVLTLDGKGRLTTEEVAEKAATTKLAQVRGATVVKGGKLQLHLSDGRNILVDKPVKSGTTVVVSIPESKIKSAHPVAEKASVILTSGKHRGKRGTIEAIEDGFVRVNTGTNTISTKKNYAFVLGGHA
jgi:small subunit ribosomal protein S4e